MSLDIIASLEAERDRINAAIAALRGGVKSNGKRHMSVEARRKIGAAAKKRWAKVRAVKKKEEAKAVEQKA